MGSPGCSELYDSCASQNFLRRDHVKGDFQETCSTNRRWRERLARGSSARLDNPKKTPPPNHPVHPAAVASLFPRSPGWSHLVREPASARSVDSSAAFGGCRTSFPPPDRVPRQAAELLTSSLVCGSISAAVFHCVGGAERGLAPAAYRLNRFVLLELRRCAEPFETHRPGRLQPPVVPFRE